MNKLKTAEEYWKRTLAILERWSCIGKREAKTGATLIGYVPHYAPEAWFHQYYVPLVEQEIAFIENSLGSSLPNAVKEFYLLTNGMNVFMDSLSIYGLRANYDRSVEGGWQPYDIFDHNTSYLYHKEKEPFGKCVRLVSIGGYNWDGTDLGFDIEGDNRERIFRYSTESGIPMNSWDNFWEMLYGETKRLAELFDDQGRKIDPDRPTTP